MPPSAVPACRRPGHAHADSSGDTRPSDLVFVPTLACCGFAACAPQTLLPVTQDVVTCGGAGLTTKPHRAQRGRHQRVSRPHLTWAVSPAAGIGFPTRRPPGDAPPRATPPPR